jgi:DNA-directed RNA polymerase specialized sigma24 family protein
LSAPRSGIATAIRPPRLSCRPIGQAMIRTAPPGFTETAGFSAGLCRVRSWRAPPNWSVIDWQEELGAVAMLAAWQAKQDYDPLQGVPLDGFVYSRVLAHALTRYRQEWRYSLRTNRVVTDLQKQVAGPEASPATAAFASLKEALQLLPEAEHWLLCQLFWQKRTEADVAAELRLSQPAVSKRKRLLIRWLRARM